MTRVALVTGAARGIGAATVAALAADGWSVVALDLACDDPRLPYGLGTRQEFDTVAAAAGLIAVSGDAASLADIAEAVGLCERELGGLDAIVAAAGVIAGGTAEWDVPLEQEQAVIEVDLAAVLVALGWGCPRCCAARNPGKADPGGGIGGRNARPTNAGRLLRGAG